MHKVNVSTEAAPRQGEVTWMHKALHDLAQPLTALECGLFLTTLDEDADLKSMREAIAGALAQCQRMMAEFRAIQDRLHAGATR